MLTFATEMSIIIDVMKSCAFFGHRDYAYDAAREKIQNLIVGLIEAGVTEFYSGDRGKFDAVCREIVCSLKQKYPQITLTLVLSYHPQEGFVTPPAFDGSVYLLERNVPRRYAIAETNKRLADRVDCVLSGVVYGFGGAYQAVEYAKKRHKNVVPLYP